MRSDGYDQTMMQNEQACPIPLSRRMLLLPLFFLICCGLGYAILNRIDWRQMPGGMSDVAFYAAMVPAPAKPYPNGHMQYRILTPYLAKPIYRVAINHIGTWDPIMFSLLLVNAAFVSVTVFVLMIVVNKEVGSYTVALGSALIYLLNFAVANSRLIGMVDAGEAFFLMLVIWSLFEKKYWLLPLWGIFGAMNKETFVPFLIVFTLGWWIGSGRAMRSNRSAVAWIVTSWVAGLISLTAVQWKVNGVLQSPLKFGLGLHQNSSYLSHFLGSLLDRNLWYIFCWLLPLGLLRIKRLPANWRMATAATCAGAFAMDAYYGGGPGTIARSLFTIAAPLLCASVALLLFPRESISDAAKA